MSFSKISALAGFLALASKVSAHGFATGIVADGVYYVGYNPNYKYMATQPVVVGWSTPEDTDIGFVNSYADADIICHKGATNAQTSATVKAGGTVEIQWTAWPLSHHGPVLDYLADCGGDCKTVDKTKLKFFKIDGVGLNDDTTLPGNWASDTLIANNNSWTVTIPSTISPGNYVLRHEIIALHAAEQANGAQNYPQCFNLEVTGSGTDSPTGTLGTALYTATDPGILVDIYATIASYVVPGPALYSGAVSASQGAVSTTGVASSLMASSTNAGVTSTLASSVPTAAPYSNSTTAAVSSAKTRKSACKAKTTSVAVLPNTSSLPAAVNVGESTSLFTTSADSVTI
ncbi:putative endoglucanase/cellulase, partial [Rhexocercosporidium sp. MPI-PUGE-AT-0058]